MRDIDKLILEGRFFVLRTLSLIVVFSYIVASSIILTNYYRLQDDVPTKASKMVSFHYIHCYCELIDGLSLEPV